MMLSMSCKTWTRRPCQIHVQIHNLKSKCIALGGTVTSNASEVVQVDPDFQTEFCIGHGLHARFSHDN